LRKGADTFFGSPALNIDLRFPHIELDTKQGTGAVLRHFTGGFGVDGKALTGTLTEADQKFADCNFTYTGP
jgi:hypothetical protein